MKCERGTTMTKVKLRRESSGLYSARIGDEHYLIERAPTDLIPSPGWNLVRQYEASRHVDVGFSETLQGVREWLNKQAEGDDND